MIHLIVPFNSPAGSLQNPDGSWFTVGHLLKLSLEIPSAAALLDVVYLPELVHIASGT